jgi:hypothetical protein
VMMGVAMPSAIMVVMGGWLSDEVGCHGRHGCGRVMVWRSWDHGRVMGGSFSHI